jgi:hypothetical protein
MLVTNDAGVGPAPPRHDHGHENNPRCRAGRIRASSGFNFRMGELAGAVGWPSCASSTPS